MNLYQILLAGLLLSGASFSCEDQGDGDTIVYESEYAPGGSYGDPTWATDGSILFAYSLIDQNGGWVYDSTGIYSMTLGAASKQFRFPLSRYGSLVGPQISPDGQWAAFERNGQIVKISLETGQLIQLTSGAPSKHFPTWSPDGRQAAFTVDEGSFAERGIYVVGSDGGTPRLLKNINSTMPSAVSTNWSPVGAQIAFVGYRDGAGFHDLCVYDTTTQKVSVLLQMSVALYAPRFSHDGSRIAFYATQLGQQDPAVWVINVDGSGLRQLTRGGGIEPAWSPDDKLILYTRYSWRRGPLDATYAKLWLIGADGSAAMQVTY